MSNVSKVDGHIDEQKMTDEQIIKALEQCGSNYKGDVSTRCNKCPLNTYRGKSACYDEVLHDLSLDLINRQKAEIERLQAMVNAELDTIHKLGDDYERALEKAILAYEETTGLKQAKAEAIKEFAERLKEKRRFCKDVFGNDVYAVYVDHIDNLVKELTE